MANASNRLATAAVPSPLADISASGNVTSTMKLDDSEVEQMKVSASGGGGSHNEDNRSYQIEVVVNVEPGENGDLDADAIADQTAKKILDALDRDLR